VSTRYHALNSTVIKIIFLVSRTVSSHSLTAWCHIDSIISMLLELITWKIFVANPTLRWKQLEHKHMDVTALIHISKPELTEQL
jgi:hypothetical protein